ncbi:MAG: hypothetical protein L3J53_08145 [Proteobacteria bacterium]|nr:hypothetical protein [Pseudomonadota bacterium]
MSNNLDILIKTKKKTEIILLTLGFFLIIVSSGIFIIYAFAPTVVSKETYNIVFKVALYGIMIAIFFYVFQLFKVSHAIEKDKNFKIQFNDERIKIIKLKSMARGFQACMIAFFFWITLLSLEILVFKSSIIAGMTMFPALAIYFIGLTTAVVSYFTLDS